ncbi:hypothetical protein Pfo_007931 [Paulownia fortunei]|nr:hypothetical protein Pfo_007931 [Paulownia fortunei]
MTTYEEFKAAVIAAKQAFPAWKNTPVSTRQRIMFKLQELIHRDIDKIVMNITTEQGKTLNGAKGDVLYGLEVVERACGMATLQMGEYVPNAANGIDTFCTREPLGVCAGICLSDFPAMVPLWMFPIAVTCGNTFILKPSEKNPGAIMMLAALAAEAGLPDGVLNIVHGNHEIVENICEDEDIKAISLISSDTAGMHIYARAAARGKHIQCNIEVKNHIIIMPDASADAALDAVLASGFGASGIQRFMAPSVAVFVGGSTPWELELVERAKVLKVNAGTEAGTDIGPVISKEAKDRICRLVQSGIDSGARLVLDGRHIVEDMAGPVLLCMQAENLEEAIAVVNSSKLGNGASIFTSSCVAARKFQDEVETSLIGINIPLPLSLPLSMYNGSRASIAGDLNFCGKADVHFYTKLKAVIQQWKELPRRRVSLLHPPTSETELSSQGISERDLGDCVVSTAIPSAVLELPSHNVSLSFQPSAEEDLPIPEALPSVSSIAEQELPRQDGSMLLPSPSKLDPMNQEVSTVMHSETLGNATGRGVSTSMPSSASDRMFSSQTSQWGEAPMALQRSENMLSSSERIYMPLDSERIHVVASTVPSMNINVASASTTDRFYIPTMSLRNESMGMTSFRHDMHRTDANLHPISERVYLPLISQQNENVVPTSQRPEVPLHSTPDNVYLSTSQRNDDLGLISLNTDVSTHRAYTSNMVLPQTNEKMYLPSTLQRNDGASSSSSSSKRIFIPSTSQEMYVQKPKISMEGYRGQGVS